MKQIALVALAAILISMTIGCRNQAGAPQSRASSVAPTGEDAIRTAIQAHLAHKGTLNLQAFDTDIKQVTMQGDHAQADVEFHVKNGPGAMQLTYALEKRDGAWSVIEGDPVGSNFSHPALNQGHGASAAPPAAGHSLADTLKSFGATAPPPTR